MFSYRENQELLTAEDAEKSKEIAESAEVQ
jgi:hypothetical protein